MTLIKGEGELVLHNFKASRGKKRSILLYEPTSHFLPSALLRLGLLRRLCVFFQSLKYTTKNAHILSYTYFGAGQKNVDLTPELLFADKIFSHFVRFVN